MMSIKEIGDKLLTAHVNGDHQEVRRLWVSVGNESDARVIELHKYSNPEITDERIGMAVVKALKSLMNKES